MRRSWGRRVRAAAAVAGLVGGVVLTAATPVLAAPAADAATVSLAGPVSPAAPDANIVQTLTIPLTVTNTGDRTLYDVGVSSLRGAPITTRDGLTTAFGGDAIEESEFTKPGPRQELQEPLAPRASARVDYVVDTSDADTGICLCVLGVYALDVVVTAADEPDGETAEVARTQTYLPSLLGVQAPVGVGWLWPLLDRPHRLTAGSVFSDDDLATSVAAGGRLDRALQVVEDVDAAGATRPGVSKSLLLLLDPDLLDELVTMTRGYTVQAADGSTTTGAGGRAAAAWLARLATVLPRHDVRTTLPADPDVVGLAARGVPVATTLDATSTARIAAALRLTGGGLPDPDLAWPVGSDLDGRGVTALRAAGATAVVTDADTDDDGAVAALGSTGGGDTTPALLADPLLAEQADPAVTVGRDNAVALQRLVVTAAMTSVQHEDDARFVFVVPDRDLDVSPGDATRAVLATTALGRPVSPLAALADAGTGTVRADLLSDQPGPPPGPLGAALDAAAAATTAAATLRSAVVTGADDVVGDLPERVQRATSNSWVDRPDDAARATADLTARTTALTSAVQVVVGTNGRYSLASADAPLVLTLANTLPVAVDIRVDVAAVGRSNGFTARPFDYRVPAGSRPTIRVPTAVTRSGRFDVTVTLRTPDGAVLGAPTPITVTSTAVGAVGKYITYGAGALLVLALLLRGVRRLRARSRAGSDPTGPDDDSRRPDGTRPEGQPTVPASPS